jgi:hypothetical protein
MDARQLRDLLDAAVGEPPHRVTITAVRHRLVRRRVLEAVAAAAVVVLIAGLGVAAARVIGTSPGPSAMSRAGPPRYYVQQSYPGTSGRPEPVMVRATATGRVTATVSCPRPKTQIPPQFIAATSNRLFFVDCLEIQKAGATYAVGGSWLYEVRLAGSGQISGYSLVPGGVLGPHRLDGIGATLNGSEVAVALGSATLNELSSPSAPANVLVLNTKTGARAMWHAGTKVFSAGDLTFTGNGRELEFVGTVPCPQPKRSVCEELRAVSPATAGGQLDSSRLLLRLSALARSPGEYIEPAIITTGGSTLTAAVIHNQTSPGSESIWVVQYSTATGRRIRVLYKLPTGNGFSYQFLSSDPTGRHLLFDAGPTTGTVNGWIDHGQLIRLKPANGSNIDYETWSGHRRPVEGALVIPPAVKPGPHALIALGSDGSRAQTQVQVG